MRIFHWILKLENTYIFVVLFITSSIASSGLSPLYKKTRCFKITDWTHRSNECCIKKPNKHKHNTHIFQEDMQSIGNMVFSNCSKNLALLRLILSSTSVRSVILSFIVPLRSQRAANNLNFKQNWTNKQILAQIPNKIFNFFLILTLFWNLCNVDRLAQNFCFSKKKKVQIE